MKNLLCYVKTSMVIWGFLLVSLFGISSAQAAKVTAVAGGESHSAALKDDGTVWAWGANGSGQIGDGNVGDGIQYQSRGFADLRGRHATFVFHGVAISVRDW